MDFLLYRTSAELKLILEHAWAQLDPPRKFPQGLRKHDAVDAIQSLSEFAGPLRVDHEPDRGDGDDENGDDDGNDLGDGGGEGRAEDLGAGQARGGGASGGSPRSG